MSDVHSKTIMLQSELRAEVRALRVFSTSVIFSAAAVASSTVLLLVPNLETLSLFFFLVGYKHGLSTGTATVITSVTVYEIFASQIYGTGGPIPFLLKFPPFLLIMISGVYFYHLKASQNGVQKEKELGSSPTSHTEPMKPLTKILYQPPVVNRLEKATQFSLYERLLLIQLGLALTVLYDVITSLGILIFVPTWEGVFISFITGIPFYLFHQVTNMILFSTLPSILIALNKMRPVY
jgi:hypothetical protein